MHRLDARVADRLHPFVLGLLILCVEDKDPSLGVLDLAPRGGGAGGKGEKEKSTSA